MLQALKILKFIFSPYRWFLQFHIFYWRFRLQSCGLQFNPTYPLVMTGASNIKIGNYFSSMGHSYLYANDGGELTIGDNCVLNTNVQLGAASGRIVIGSNVLIGPNVVIRAANHGINRHIAMRLQPHSFGEILIKDDVWIGANAVITSGVVLETGTIVGAGAVVTRSTQAYEIVGGVPAKVIDERR